MADQQQVLGIDVSHWQGDVDWSKVAAAGASFAFAKATEGTGYVDPKFLPNWQAMAAAGLARGAYCFFQPDQDAAAQAELFLKTVAIGAGDLPSVLDCEAAPGDGDAAAYRQKVETWLTAVGRDAGKQPMVYASPSFAEKWLGEDFGGYPLWVAHYGVSQPTVPSGWKTWAFWQYTQSGSIDGVSGNVDRDRFNGPSSALRALAC